MLSLEVESGKLQGESEGELAKTHIKRRFNLFFPVIYHSESEDDEYPSTAASLPFFAYSFVELFLLLLSIV